MTGRSSPNAGGVEAADVVAGAVVAFLAGPFEAASQVAERLIEVKATRGGPTTPFYLTRTEREVSLEHPAAWRLYRLHDLSTVPGLFVLPPPPEASVRLEAETWRAGF